MTQKALHLRGQLLGHRTQRHRCLKFTLCCTCITSLLELWLCLPSASLFALFLKVERLLKSRVNTAFSALRTEHSRFNKEPFSGLTLRSTESSCPRLCDLQMFCDCWCGTTQFLALFQSPESIATKTSDTREADHQSVTKHDFFLGQNLQRTCVSESS